MPTRTAEATWTGALTDGNGTVEFGSGAYEGPYSFASRFEEGEGTNPEELIGAAEASCYAMALANMLDGAGHDPERIHAEASVHLDADALEVTNVDLTVEGRVPGIDEETFREHAEEARVGCPISKALAGPDIGLTATLAD